MVEIIRTKRDISQSTSLFAASVKNMKELSRRGKNIMV
jgi:hypothetical protein